MLGRPSPPPPPLSDTTSPLYTPPPLAFHLSNRPILSASSSPNAYCFLSDICYQLVIFCPRVSLPLLYFYPSLPLYMYLTLFHLYLIGGYPPFSELGVFIPRSSSRPPHLSTFCPRPSPFPVPFSTIFLPPSLNAPCTSASHPLSSLPSQTPLYF